MALANSRQRHTRRFGQWYLLLGLSALLVMVLVGAVMIRSTPTAQATCSTSPFQPELVTDRADYPPGEIVHVDGCGFQAYIGQTLPILISWPDSSIHPGSVTIGGSGTFAYDYQLPLNAQQGTYTVEVDDLSLLKIATTSFTDAAIHFSQCANDSDSNDVQDDCDWVNGALNQTNSIYFEGDSVPQRLFHRISAAGVHAIQFEYDFTKGDVYAYDFLTDVEETQSGAFLNPCQGAPAFATGVGDCDGSNSIFTSAVPVTVASDTFGPATIAGHPAEKVSDAEHADNPPREMLVGCNPGPCTFLVTHSITHSPATTCLRNCGDSSVSITLTLMTPSANTLVAVWFGGHIAEAADPDTGSSPPDGWGTGCSGGSCGASAIGGAPFHMQYKTLDGNSVGNRDNQIQIGAVATPTPTATITDTPTPTATDTPTPTATDTPTPTATDTPTPTATDTPTPTATDTPTPTATDTPTPTATDTPTPTATDTPTPTATDTPTPTATDTPTPTATNTPTATATDTPTPTATDTQTPTATDTRVATATDTPTPTATNTATATSTATPTDTATATPTDTATATPTATPTPTDSPTPTETPVATPTDSPTPVDTATPVATPTPTPTPTNTPITPTNTPTNTPTQTSTPQIVTPSGGDTPRMVKAPSLQNVFLTRQGAKIPPADCLAGTNTGVLVEQLDRPIPPAPDPKDPNSLQQLGAFEFEVHYDSTKVCVEIQPIGFWATAGSVSCIIEDSVTQPTLEDVARIGCVTSGKTEWPDTNTADGRLFANVIVRPQPEVYSQSKPDQDNGVVIQLANVNCDISDLQGHPIALGGCDDAAITFRYLEGDVQPDCVVDALDAQSVAFRWGVDKTSLIYNDFMNLEPAGPQGDSDIDVNDVQFIYGRFGSTCSNPWPPQPPINPKA